MKKILLILSITFIAVLMLLPKIIGTQVEAHYFKLWQQLANESGFEVDHGEFKSSWFSSSVTSVISVPVDPSAPEPVKIGLTIRVAHGPLLFGHQHSMFGLAGGELSFSIEPSSEELKNIVDQVSLTASPLVTVHLGLTGAMEVELSIDKFSYAAEGVQIRSGGIRAQWRSSKDFKTSSGAITTYPISLSGQGVNLEIDTMLNEFETSQHNGLYVLGSHSVELKQIDFRSAATTASISDVKLSYSGTEKNNRLNNRFDLSIEKLLVPAPINSAAYSAELLQVDPEFYAQWANLSQQQSQDPVLLKQQAMDLATLLLKSDTALHQTLRLQGMGGYLDATARVEYQSSSKTYSTTTIDNVADLLAQLHITLSLAVDKTILDQAGITPILAEYVEQDLVRLKNDRYQMEVALDKGSLNINQKPAPEEIANQLQLALTGNPQQTNTAKPVTETSPTEVETSSSSKTSNKESDSTTEYADEENITDTNVGNQNEVEQGGEQ
ncbi:MAG: DUF945 family protein [Porticoccaceae bacterium]|nr:DUF945 family protein [Porticoccaceae bacterium]